VLNIYTKSRVSVPNVLSHSLENAWNVLHLFYLLEINCECFSSVNYERAE